MRNLVKSMTGRLLHTLPVMAGIILLCSAFVIPGTDKNEKNACKADKSQAPLVIINDAVIIDAEMIKAIQPQDIESITVLKDESSIKEYGVKGMNGVIKITLKEGARLDLTKEAVDKATEKSDSLPVKVTGYKQ